MASAVPTFNESTRPDIGIVTHSSAVASALSDSPVPSAPASRATRA